MSNSNPTFFNKLCKNCNKVTTQPHFPAVVVFVMSFLVAGAIIEQTSALDGGVECNTHDTQKERSLCLKLNGVALILAITVPIMASIAVYKLAKDQASKCHLSRKERLFHK